MSSMLHLRATADVSAGAYEVVANGSPETGEVSWLHLAAWVVGAAGAALLAAFAAFMCGGGDDSDRMDDDDSFEVRCAHVCVRKAACTPHETLWPCRFELTRPVSQNDDSGAPPWVAECAQCGETAAGDMDDDTQEFYCNRCWAEWDEGEGGTPPRPLLEPPRVSWPDAVLCCDYVRCGGVLARGFLGRRRAAAAAAQAPRTQDEPCGRGGVGTTTGGSVACPPVAASCVFTLCLWHVRAWCRVQDMERQRADTGDSDLGVEDGDRAAQEPDNEFLEWGTCLECRKYALGEADEFDDKFYCLECWDTWELKDGQDVSPMTPHGNYLGRRKSRAALFKFQKAAATVRASVKLSMLARGGKLGAGPSVSAMAARAAQVEAKQADGDEPELFEDTCTQCGKVAMGSEDDQTGEFYCAFSRARGWGLPGVLVAALTAACVCRQFVLGRVRR